MDPYFHPESGPRKTRKSHPTNRGLRAPLGAAFSFGKGQACRERGRERSATRAGEREREKQKQKQKQKKNKQKQKTKEKEKKDKKNKVAAPVRGRVSEHIFCLHFSRRGLKTQAKHIFVITAAFAGLENTEGLGHFFGKMHFRSKPDRFFCCFFPGGPFFLKFWTRFLLEFALSPRRGHVLLIPDVELSNGDFRFGKFFLRYGSGSSGSKWCSRHSAGMIFRIWVCTAWTILLGLRIVCLLWFFLGGCRFEVSDTFFA